MNETLAGTFVGDIIETPGLSSFRLYQVVGVDIGAPGCESVVELVSIDKKPCDHVANGRIIVPAEMILFGVSSGLFTRTRA